MREPTGPALPDDLLKAYTAATELARDQRLLDALAESRADISLRREATRDPGAFLEGRGLELPSGLAIRFGQRPRFRPGFQPGPDWEFFSVRLFDCRSYWIWETDPVTGERTLSQREICWGFEIVPHPLPGGPIAGGPTP
jgi:hypothetical protein